VREWEKRNPNTCIYKPDRCSWIRAFARPGVDFLRWAITEAVPLHCPPRLTEAVAGPAILPRITEAGNQANRLGAPK
jgi:hypothetical protein